jgi:hypothetical protein
MHVKNYFYVTGVRRSGNHAIQTWLTGVVGEPFVKLNYTPTLWDKRLALFKEEYKGPETSLIQGAEEAHSIRFVMPNAVNLIVENRKQILILRHPYNNFASLVRFSPTHFKPKNARRFINLWTRYAMEFIGATSALPDKVCVCYDTWFNSEQERQRIAVELGVPFSDSTLNEQDENWGVSSFDGYKYQGRAQEMNVLERWKYFKDDPRFKAFAQTFANHQAAELAKQIFGNLLEV